MTTAEVNAKALELGYTKVGGAFSAAALVQARYAVIMAQSSNAQGDFARTSDSLATQTAIENAKADDLQATLGQKLLPYTIALTKAEIALLDSIPKTSDAFAGLNDAVTTGATNYTDIAKKGNQYNDFLKTISGGLINIDYEQNMLNVTTAAFGGTVMQATKDASQALVSASPAFVQFQKDADASLRLVADDISTGLVAPAIASMGAMPSLMEAAFKTGVLSVSSALTADTQAMLDALKAPISGKQRVKNDQDLLDAGSALGKKLAAGLNSSDPVVRAAAQKVHDDAVADLLLNETILMNAKIKDRGQDNASVTITTKDITPPKKNAAGGPLGAFDASWVGEQGAEVRVFAQPSYILTHTEALEVAAGKYGPASPASSQSGTQGSSAAPLIGTQHNYITGVTPDDVERQTTRSLRRAQLQLQLSGGRR
jgi:hypothetical protein